MQGAEVYEVMGEYLGAVYRGDEEEVRRMHHEKSAVIGMNGRRCYIGTPEPYFREIGKGAAERGIREDECVSVVRRIHMKGTRAEIGLFVEGYFGREEVEMEVGLIKDGGRWKVVSTVFEVG